MYKSYACLPEDSRGRIYPENPTPYRTEFERDRDRIIHSSAFKRLQYKTQVFVNHKGDHYRNRMTHSMEVASIARSISKTLGLCENLAETVALAHDLGHSPFGHAGEDMLNECMKDYGGFSHNAHVFKILTNIEKKYAAYNGLNLTWEVLEGIVKHNGPIKNSEAYSYVFAYDKQNSLDLGHFSSAESQITALADDIAYICHDLEDSVRAEILSYQDISEIQFVDEYVHDIKKQFPDLTSNRLIYEVSRKLTHRLIDNLLIQTNHNITKYQIKKQEDIRNLNCQLVEFTDKTRQEIELIKDFFVRKVYKHDRIASVTLQSKNVVKKLFQLYIENIDLLPFSWRDMITKSDKLSKMSIVADYIAGMTDRFAINKYKAFFNLNFADIEL